MPRFTGLVKPDKYRPNQCKYCKRYFANIPLHLATGQACKQLRGLK